MRLRLPIALSVVVAAGVTPALAHAQDAAGADAAFQKGHQLFEAKRFAEACPNFAESYRLDPVSGALLALASCHEAEGKLASAWNEYTEVATIARREGKNDRAEAAQQRAASLAPKLGKITIALAQGADTIVGLEVKRDGVVVAPASIGTAVAVDRGEHTIDAAAPGREPFTKRVTTVDGVTELVPIPLLAEVGPAAPPPPPPAQPTQPAEPAQPSSGAFPMRTVGIVTAAAGVVAAGIGGYFGLQAISKNADSKTQGCNGDVCSGTAKQTRLDAVSAGNTSTALFVIGGLLAAGGVVMFIVGGPAKQGDTKPAAAAVAAAPAVDANGAGVALTGRF